MPVINGTLNLAAQQLIRALRGAREARRIPSRTLSAQLGFSHARVSHWETGRQVPTVADVVALLDAMDIQGAERDIILTYAREANTPNPLARIPGIPAALADAIAYERTVSSIQEWAPVIVPELLQTSTYTRALATRQGCDRLDVDTRSLIQSGRQQVLARASDPVELTAVIGQAALCEPGIASPQVMAEQLDFLIAQAARPNVTVRVMSPSVGWHRGLTGPFRLYRLPDGQEFARHDHLGSACVVIDRTGDYRSAVAEMISKALSAEKSVRRLTEIAQAWRGAARAQA